MYTFTGQAKEKYVYYTMAIYQHTWGLTNFRKSAYQVKVVTDATHPVQSSRPPVELPVAEVSEQPANSEA